MAGKLYRKKGLVTDEQKGTIFMALETAIEIAKSITIDKMTMPDPESKRILGKK